MLRRGDGSLVVNEVYILSCIAFFLATTTSHYILNQYKHTKYILFHHSIISGFFLLLVMR